MVVAMVVLPGEETIPYHLMFLAVTLVYGFRVWPMPPTAVVIGAITIITGMIFYVHFRDGRIDAPELSEVPLMPLLLLAMVWHARRRAEAQRQVEEMAEQRQRLLQREREFLRDTSHAIRTPVTIARGHVELIQGTLADPLAYDDSDVVLRQLDRMDALSTRLLALARLDSGGVLDRGDLDLDRFVEQIGANWTGTAEREWVVDRADPGQTGPVRVGADREWLELAVDALVENAVHFTEPGTGSSCPVDATAGSARSSWPTPEPASRPRTCPTCSSASGTAVPRTACRAVALAWRWPRQRLTPWAAVSSYAASWARAPASSSPCPSPDGSRVRPRTGRRRPRSRRPETGLRHASMTCSSYDGTPSASPSS